MGFGGRNIGFSGPSRSELEVSVEQKSDHSLKADPFLPPNSSKLFVFWSASYKRTSSLTFPTNLSDLPSPTSQITKHPVCIIPRICRMKQKFQDKECPGTFHVALTKYSIQSNLREKELILTCILWAETRMLAEM